jgi:hypothetical protein
MNVAYEEIDFDADPQYSASVLISALKLPDANVRRYVVNALAELPIKPETVVPVLVEALRDKDEQVREHAVIALAKVGSPAVPALVEAPPSASKVDASPNRPFQPGGLMEFFQCVLTARRSKRMSVVG